MSEPLTIECFEDSRDTMTLNDELFDDGICIDVVNCGESTYIYIEKTKAEQIVNHLIKVFDITPLHD